MIFDPYKKGGGAEQVLAMLKGGGTKSFEVVLTRELEVFSILMEGAKCFHPLNIVLPPPPPRSPTGVVDIMYMRE